MVLYILEIFLSKQKKKEEENMKQVKFSFIKLALIFLTIILLIAFALLLYNHTLKKNLSTAAETTLGEILEQQKLNFDSELRAEMLTIQGLAVSMAYLPNEPTIILDVMEKTLTQTKFENIFVVNVSGKGIADNGRNVDISNFSYFQNALQGKTVIGNPLQAAANGQKAIPISSPIYQGENLVGVLICTYRLEQFDSLFLSSFGGKGYTVIVTKEGSIIACTKNDYVLIKAENLFHFFKQTEFQAYDDLETIKNKMKSGRYGKISYSIGDHFRHAQYKPLAFNDWYIFSVVPEEVVMADTAVIAKNAIYLTAAIIIGFSLFFLYFLWIQKKANKEKQIHTAELERTAYYDELTGQPNLVKFKLDLKKLLIDHPTLKFLIGKFDIVNFKMINEIFGFSTGDEIVRQVAKIILEIEEKHFITICSLTRITADEFILFELSGSSEDAELRRTMFERTFFERISPLIGTHKIEFRYGRYFVEPGETDVNSIIEKVNLAHRIAKTQKTTPIYDYDDSLRQKLLREATMESHMEGALEHLEFQIYLQPKYHLKTETVAGSEALVRWKTGDGKLIPPNEFIPLFEKNGFVVKLDFYMLEQVCKLMRKWMDASFPVLPVSVNFSRLHLNSSDFVEHLSSIANHYGIPKNLIEIELTESTIFNNEDVLVDLLNRLHEVGFTLSMDDFGTGYSSLGLLKNLPVDVLKIDKGFFDQNRYESRAKTVIQSVIQMAKKLGIHTVAEGVETKEHIDLLREIGCDMVQGYYYSKPMPAEEFFNFTKKTIL